MPFTTTDLIDHLKETRAHFMKHLAGAGPDLWDWKPYPECKSVRETLIHLVVDDRAALESLQNGKEPEYDRIAAETQEQAGESVEALITILTDSHAKLLEYIERTYADEPLDSEVSVFGSTRKLGLITYFSSEDFYHAGQVGFIRQAIDPKWDYYAAVYGGE